MLMAGDSHGPKHMSTPRGTGSELPKERAVQRNRSQVSRRTFAAALGGLGIAAAVPLGAQTAHAATTDEDLWARRAAVSYAALQQYFAVPDGSGLYREQYPVAVSDPAYSYEWPFSQAHVATLDMTGMQGAGQRFQAALAAHERAQMHYWSDSSSTGLPGFASGVEPPYGTGDDFYYDDNEWVGLKDVQQWAMYRDDGSLRQAQQIFELVVSGWDADPSHSEPGGVFWTQASWSRDRNTVSNMPGAELGLRLYQITGEQHYLDWSLRMYRWANTYLQRPDGLYWDHLDLRGNIEKTIWSYTQGASVGVNVLLYQATHEQGYLSEAERIAQAAQSYFTAEGRLDKQPPFFNSIYFKNLLLLQSETHRFDYRDAMQAYADRVWRTKRDSATGLFHFGGSAATQMIEQAAMVQIYAVLAWAPGHHRLLY